MHPYNVEIDLFYTCILIGPNKVKKVSGPPTWSIFLPSETTQTDKQIITKRHYDRKYIHIQTVMLLNMHKNLENMHNRIHKP